MNDKLKQAALDNLNILANLRLTIEERQAEHQAEVDKILTPAMRRKIKELDASLAQDLEDVRAEEARITAIVKDNVVKLGETVKGLSLQAVWAKGRVKWNDDKLNGYAAAHPEILAFRDTGDPSVSIREVK